MTTSRQLSKLREHRWMMHTQVTNHEVEVGGARTRLYNLRAEPQSPVAFSHSPKCGPSTLSLQKH